MAPVSHTSPRAPQGGGGQGAQAASRTREENEWVAPSSVVYRVPWHFLSVAKDKHLWLRSWVHTIRAGGPSPCLPHGNIILLGLPVLSPYDYFPLPYSEVWSVAGEAHRNIYQRLERRTNRIHSADGTENTASTPLTLTRTPSRGPLPCSYLTSPRTLQLRELQPLARGDGQLSEVLGREPVSARLHDPGCGHRKGHPET